MLREEVVFGPIHSRRLGNSLGINLLPSDGKLCSMDCIYCECGWNKDGISESALPDAATVRAALETALSACLLEGTSIDSITFSGAGEATLNPDFPQVIDDTIALRDAFFPEAKVSVLSNATTLSNPKVVEALKKVDNPILKIDAPTSELVRRIDRPVGAYCIEKVIENIKKFEGNFILQTMLLKSDDFDSSSPEVIGGWMDIVRDIRPRQIMVYTIARPTPQEGLRKFSAAEMRELVKPLIDEGFDIKISE